VYVKCASTADAGILHGEINGWWLDNGLVVVKFLKQDKYHQRFPSSINSSTVMYPSSNIYVTNVETVGANGHDDYFDDEIDDDFE
jgi:membrane protein Man1